jgi:hypothetical protein
MSINFPNSPSLNQLYTYDNKTWEWNGIYWEVYSALTSYITSAYTSGDGVSNIYGISNGNIVLKSFSGFNINIVNSGNKLTFSASTSSIFTGGTVSGPTNFVGGLSANTISATTYLNLPTDIRVTGGTLSGGVATFTNNTGGTFSVSGFLTGATFNGGTVTGATNFTGGITANTISATTITADDTPKVIYRLPNAVNVGNTTAATVTTITTFDITGLQVGMTIVADGLFSSTSNANQKTYQLSLSGASSNPTVTTTTGGHRAQLLMRVQGSNTIRMSLANAFGATSVNPVFVDVTGSAGVFTFVARCSVNGTGGGVPVNTLESLTLTRF